MKQGAFLEKNKKETAGKRAAQGAKPRRKRRRQQRRMLKIGIGILTGLLIAAVALMLVLGKKTPLEGKWVLDQVTSYVFYADGTGALVLPSAEYGFTYQLQEDTLYLDYADEKAKDSQYTYEIKGNKLYLNGGNATTQGEWVCTKSE